MYYYKYLLTCIYLLSLLLNIPVWLTRHIAFLLFIIIIVLSYFIIIVDIALILRFKYLNPWYILD